MNAVVVESLGNVDMWSRISARSSGRAKTFCAAESGGACVSEIGRGERGGGNLPAATAAEAVSFLFNVADGMVIELRELVVV